jgi:glycosyltransferase involved in cell wall biosynthesis
LNYPNVLLVNGEAIGVPSGTGITMMNLFSGWPKDRLMQLFSAPVQSPPGTCDRNYMLDTPSRSVIRAIAKSQCGAELESQTTTRREQTVRSWVRTLPSAVLRIGRTALDLVDYRLPSWFFADLAEFGPEVIYTCSGNIQITQLASQLASRLGVPIVPHFMDDWISTKYKENRVLALHNRKLKESVWEMMRQAAFGMAISAVMAAEYADMFQMPFHVFMNCVPTMAHSKPVPPIDPATGMRLVYVGGLHLNRWHSLKAIGDALTYLAGEGVRGKLYIYAPAGDLREHGTKLTGPSIELAGSVSLGQIPAAMQSAHVLLHVESFRAEDRRYTRLSISTKIPQYLSEGRALFCYGPREVASVRFVRDHNCGVVTDSEDQLELRAALGNILQNGALRERLAANGLKVVRQEFDAMAVRERFRLLLEQVG